MDRKKLLNQIIEKHFDTHQNLKILEAGCGSALHLDLLENYDITGIDISMQQLERNNYISNKICADLQTYSFESNSFNVIICWYVLEHIKHPAKVMLNFTKALKSNGIIILGLPNIWSVKGIITRFSPLFIHVWFYQYVLKSKTAGKNDHGPFKTYLKNDISPNNVKQFAIENKLEIVHFSYFSSPYLKEKLKRNLLINIVQKFVNVLFLIFSLGRITNNNTDFIVVIKK